MSGIRPALTAEVSRVSEPADAMLKRVLKAAEILAAVKQEQTFPAEVAENHTENPDQQEVQYRKD